MLVAGALIAGMAETVIADVHDGDHSTRPSATITAQDAPVPGAPELPRHTPSAPHTCHCVHAHVISLPAAETVAEIPPTPTPQFIPIERMLSSVAPEPHFRPPVA